MKLKKPHKTLALLGSITVLAGAIIAGLFLFYTNNSLVSEGINKRASQVSQLKHLSSLIQIFNNPDPIRTAFIIQNDNELRPSGGFITAIALADLKGGTIQGLEVKSGRSFEASQNLKTTLPKSLEPFISTPYLTLRDSNLSPDFPTSMANVSRFLVDADPSQPPPQLFIAINTKANQELVGLTGPLSFSINGHPVSVDQNNVTDELERLTDLDYAQLGLTIDTRKNILAEYARALLPVLQASIKNHPLRVAALAQKLTSNYDLQIWSSEPTIQEHLSPLKTAQIVSSNNTTDMLMIVDANLASRKTDPFIEQSATYKVTINDQKTTARLNIQYHNTAKEGPLTTTYNDYLQIFVPANSKLVTTKGLNNTLSTTSLGLTRFTGNFSIKPGGTHSVQLDYQLPASLYNKKGSDYRLLFLRESGGHIFPINYITNVDKQEGNVIFDSSRDQEILLEK